MKSTNKRYLVAILIGACFCLAARAEVLDRPSGIKIGERMTLRPYVSLSITYDSNVNGNSGSVTGSSKKDDFLWTVSPGLSLHYNAETWSVILSGYYNYRQYFDKAHRNNDHNTFGEDLRFNWSNASGSEKGWSLILGQGFQQITTFDDMVLGDGSNYGGDSRQFQFSAALQRRFNQNWHADVNAAYYWLDYDNSSSSRASYFGWDRWLVGGEIGYAASKWADILISGSYHGYSQDNTAGSEISSSSRGYSVQAGFASFMTERISYRALAGWSRFEYGDGAASDDGFIYTLSGNWKIGETWNTMLLGTSYYQPSERQYASQARVDSISWGIAKMMVRGKLRASLDIRYRHENNEYAGNDPGSWDYSLDVWTGRLGLDYSLNRFLSFFVYGEYQTSMNDHASSRGGMYDYDRWRVTGGLRISY